MVYFIQASDVGLVKIGYTSKDDPWSRMTTLQTASPVTLKLLGVLDGGQDLEKLLHERFKEARIKGEWFRPVPELLDFIEKNCDRTRPVEFDVIVSKGRSSVPVWQRCALRFEDDVYVAAAASGRSEESVFLNSGWDGRGVVIFQGHVFASLEWMEMEYFDRRSLWDLIRQNVNEAA